MALASLLIQPQKVQRAAAADADAALVHDTIRLLGQLAADGRLGGALRAAAQDAVQAAAARLVARARTNEQRARERLRDWIAPANAWVEQITGAAGGEGSDAGLALARQILSQLTDLAKALTLDQLRGHVALLLDVLENDLGMSGAFIEGEIWALVDDLAARLEQFPPGTPAPEREHRAQAASVLRRIRRRIASEFHFPSLDRELIARRLLELLQAAKLDAYAQKAACIGDNLDDALGAATDLVRLVPFPGTTEPATGVPRSAPFALNPMARALSRAPQATRDPAGERLRYSWYASWLLGSKQRTGGSILAALPFPWMPDPTADIWIDTQEHKAYRTYNLWGGGGEELKDPATNEPYPGPIQEWMDLPPFSRISGDDDHPYYTFSRSGDSTREDREFMESLARHSAWAADALRMVAHLSSWEEGDWASNLANALYFAGQGTFKLAKESPFNWWVPSDWGANHHTLWWILTRFPLATLAGSFQGMHTRANFRNALIFWLTLLLADGGEAYLVDAFAGGLRNALLSFVTLLKYNGPVRHEPFPDDRPDDRPANRKEIDGVANLFVTLFGQIQVWVVPKEDYCYPRDVDGHWVRMIFGRMIGAGIGFGFLGALAGTVVAECVAWAEDWEALGWKILSAIPVVILSFYPTLFTSGENKTDDGTYNPNGPAFPGYPARDTSPYRLPYAAGVSYQCAQGNQGIWSHNNVLDLTTGTPQIYAYDFAMDEDDEILAARSGTVVDYFDWVPNNTDPDAAVGVPAADAGLLVGGQTNSDTWNFVLIRHDRDDAGNPLAPDNAHDRDQGGTVVTTYGVYGHGRTGSVRAVFGTRGVAPANIIGQVIRRGQPIMRAGDTGRSAYNHLHMHIQPGPAAGSPVARGNLVRRTIPFVLGDVAARLELNRFTAGTEGVPASLNFYTSQNTRIP